MLVELALLFESKNLRAIDKAFGRFIQNSLTENDPVIGFAILASFEFGRGNVCVDFSMLNHINLFDFPKTQSMQIAEWLQLVSSEAVNEVLTTSIVVSKGDKATPLVFDGKRLYLHRNWQAEQLVAKQIRARAVEIALPSNTASVLDSLFGKAQGETDWQKVAAATALSYGFSVISGGPGTGKTTTVAKLLAAIVKSAETPLIIKLVAPTGKAANRLTESIGNAIASLPVEAEIKEAIPKQAFTIHRLLGTVHNRVDFRHHQGNRLHLDVLVVDEASMVDLSLMANLLKALPDKARVILLGDRNQLASVEAGAVLGDICAHAESGFGAKRANQLVTLTGFALTHHQSTNAVADGVCLLRKSYRFHENSGIGQLAYAINAGSKTQIERVWAKKEFTDITWHELNDICYQNAIEQAVSGYSDYLNALKNGEAAKDILKKFANFRLLCVLNEGIFGITGLNQAIENRLIKEKLIEVGDAKFYIGRPIIVKQNDHGLGLYNGDIGIVVEQKQGLRVIFEMADGTIKSFLPSRLPMHQTAYAMTIHKSQGSEFAHTLMLLPPEANPVMTRELVYTGVTRAKNKLDIYATRQAFYRSILRKTERFSGLIDAMQVDAS